MDSGLRDGAFEIILLLLLGQMRLLEQRGKLWFFTDGVDRSKCSKELIRKEALRLWALWKGIFLIVLNLCFILIVLYIYLCLFLMLIDIYLFVLNFYILFYIYIYISLKQIKY